MSIWEKRTNFHKLSVLCPSEGAPWLDMPLFLTKSKVKKYRVDCYSVIKKKTHTGYKPACGTDGVRSATLYWWVCNEMNPRASRWPFSLLTETPLQAVPPTALLYSKMNVWRTPSYLTLLPCSYYNLLLFKTTVKETSPPPLWSV